MLVSNRAICPLFHFVLGGVLRCYYLRATIKLSSSAETACALRPASRRLWGWYGLYWNLRFILSGASRKKGLFSASSSASILL